MGVRDTGQVGFSFERRTAWCSTETMGLDGTYRERLSGGHPLIRPEGLASGQVHTTANQGRAWSKDAQTPRISTPRTPRATPGKGKNVLALTLCLLFGVELAIYGTGGVLLWQWLEPEQIILLAVGISLGIRSLLLAVVFGFAWINRVDRPPEWRIGPLQTAKLVIAEFAALLTLYSVLQPLELWLRRRDPGRGAVRQGPPVLLVHGLLCNGGYWWPMKRYLRREGINNLFTLNLEPLFGDINRFAEQVAEQVEHIRAKTGAKRVILVGHSMGGLVIRVYVQRYGGRTRVAKIITLGSPHHGSAHARLLGGADIRQMRPGNPWLGELNKAEMQPVPMTSIYSYHDNLVAPQDSPVLAHGKNIPVAGVGHLAMTFSKECQRLVYQEIVKGGGDWRW